MATSAPVKLEKVILSYPNLYTPELYQGQPTDRPQYSAVFLVSKDQEDQLENIWEVMMETAAEEFGKGKIPKNFRTTERCCIKPITLTEEENGINFEGWQLKAKGGTNRAGTAPQEIFRLDRTMKPVALEAGSHDQGIFYPGCIVDAKITMWTSKSYAHARSNLLLVRFRADGPQLGGGSGGASLDDLVADLDDLSDAEADL